ncbi:MAG: ABC transporter permease [Candidatus Desantisbacteria bacterium]
MLFKKKEHIKYESFSPIKIAFNRLKKHRLAMVSLYVLIFLYTIALFAEIIAPYPAAYECRMKPYHPPVSIHFFDAEGFSFIPFIYQYKTELTQYYEKRYVPILNSEFGIQNSGSSKRHYLHLFIKGEPYRLWGIIPCNIHLFGAAEPAHLYLLGSDWNGRDILSRLIYGARISLSVGIIGIFISFSLGMIIGGISGYFGGMIDTILMRLVEIIMCFPDFYLLLALRAAFPLDLNSTAIYLLIIGIMSFIGWAGMARVIRGIILSVREREYIVAARSQGSHHISIIIKHALPNTLSYAIVAATLSIPGYILGEAALSLLGLGISEPQASWGNMLTASMNLSDMVEHPWILVPGAAIFITIMAFNLLGDGLRDAFDPGSLI